MKNYFYIFCITYFSFNVQSQVGGEQVYKFLNLSTSARQVALGGEVLTLMDDVNQPLWNPSVINPDLDGFISLNYSSYLAGINIGSLSYARLISRRFGTIYGNITYLDYGSLIESDQFGNETGIFKANDLAVSLGYAINLPWTNLYLGTNLKLINSNISTYASFGAAFDFSILYYSPYKSYTFTIVARNFGSQIKSFNGTNEPMPFKLSIGASYQLEYVPLKWYLTLDNIQNWDISVPNPSEQTIDLEGNATESNVSFLDNTMRHFIVGAELFPESLVNLRLGYNFRRAAELKLQNIRTFAGFSVGFGIQMNRLKLNYAYSKYHSASNASTFSLEIDLNY